MSYVDSPKVFTRAIFILNHIVPEVDVLNLTIQMSQKRAISTCLTTICSAETYVHCIVMCFGTSNTSKQFSLSEPDMATFSL